MARPPAASAPNNYNTLHFAAFARLGGWLLASAEDGRKPPAALESDHKGNGTLHPAPRCCGGKYWENSLLQEGAGR
jgi:hypothetical protein